MRRPVNSGQRGPMVKTKSYPAPTGGWVANENLASPGGRWPDGTKRYGAERIDNGFPTATGVRMRGGSEKYATVGSGGAVVSLFDYMDGTANKRFAATGSALYDITTVADPDVSPIALLTGMASGAWISVQFATGGGIFTLAVNGSDHGLIYNGTNFYPVTTVATNALNFDAQTAAFTVGATLTGGTSGASATILGIVDNGTTGTLYLGTVTSGPFQNNETIADDNGTPGSATADGTLSAGVASAITGIATSSLSNIWTHKKRVWFVEKNSMNAWYLPVDSIAGAAVKFPLGGIFKRGGKLLAGASWSLDENAGLSATCAFWTDQGEVAIYRGDNPSSASSWQLVGVYRVGIPLGPKAWLQAGGDIIIATDIGMIPLSEAIRKDIAALGLAAVSYPIETAWNSLVEERDAGWQIEMWPTKQMAIVAPPPVDSGVNTIPVANVRTGAWGRYTGWDINCLKLFGDLMMAGTSDGKVIELEVTGSDEGAAYTFSCVPQFEDLRAPANKKIGLMARAVYRAPEQINDRLSLQSDFAVALPSDPDDAVSAAGNVWGAGVWGTSVWGAGLDLATFQEWRSVGGAGYALAPAIQITSGRVPPPNVELIRIDLNYDVATDAIG